MVARKRQVDLMSATLLEWSARITDLKWRATTASPLRQAQLAEQIGILRGHWQTYDGLVRDTANTSEAVFRDMVRAAAVIADEFRRIYVQASSRFLS
ncbi:MAG: hypothetical protein U1E14_15240 [Geminicoccaceae bacterium]